jgi:acetyl-CoA C-acetyltransferase
MSQNVYIVAAQRTAVGSFLGQWSQTPAPRLGAEAIKAALKQSQLEASMIEECVMGQVLTAGVGQAPARQAAIYAGLNESTPCMTINKVCGSGLKAIALAADSIALGRAHTVIAGGQENMTLAPHLLENSRAGFRMGNFQSTDSMIKDGLWDPYNNIHMGQAAELCAKEYKFTRDEQDAFAIDSYKKAHKAQADGIFKSEITPVEITAGKEKLLISEDEEPKKAKFDKMPGLKPAFDKEGTITAANASKINDGAAALVLVSEKTLKEKGLKPLAKVVSQGYHAHDPKWFTTAPGPAIKKALVNANLKASDIDLFEINEAFAIVAMAAARDLQIPPDRLNVHGGAIAIGHPIGASGARLMVSLLNSLKVKNKTRGLVSLCIGGGEGIAMIVERIS